MRARGFSLVELMISVAISLVAVAAGMVLLVGSQRWFQSGVDDRAVQENARGAMDEITTNLRAAGYGLEPTFTFDMGLIANVPMDRLPQGLQARFGGYQCADGTCRDKIDGPDELVFYSRDPLWERDVASVGSNALTLVAPRLTPLEAGQVLQIMCYGSANQWAWAYVTVSSIDTPNPGNIRVTLQAPTGQPYDFPTQNALLTGQPCFSAGTASVKAFKIDRYRYYVQAVDDSTGAQVAWETPGSRPYLLLDQGLQDGGQPVLRPIAPDVEDLQVAYVYSEAATGNQVQGATAGVQVTANVAGDDTGFNLAPTIGIPTFSTPSLDPLRTMHHPANVRAVRLSLTVRTPRAGVPLVPQNGPCLGNGDPCVPAAFNRPDVAGEGSYRRVEFETTVYTRNLETRLPVFPQYDPNYATANCCTGASCAGNCGGG